MANQDTDAVNWTQLDPFGPELLEYLSENFDQNNLRIIFNAMANYHLKIVGEKDQQINKLSVEKAETQKNYLSFVQEKDQEINECKAELVKIRNNLKMEQNKCVKVEEENKTLKKKVKDAEMRATIKETFVTNFEKLRKRKETLASKLKNLEGEITGHEYKRISFGEKVHKKLDSVYQCLKLPVNSIQFQENEPEKEFKVYVQLFKKVENLERHLKQTRF